MPFEKRLQLIKLGISEINAITIVSSSARLQKFDELSKIHGPVLVANAIINSPIENLKNLSISEKALFTDEAKIREVAEKVIASNNQIIESIKAGKLQAIELSLAKLKKN